MNKKTNASIGIYLSAILMMGIIGISSSLSTIAAQFPDLDQTTITGLISIPSLVVIPVTVFAGKLMDYFSKKSLLIVGILLFIIGGTAPYFLNDFNAILVSRGVFGAGVGFIQVLSAALVAEHYEGSMRDQVMGRMNSSQMLGGIIMSYLGGRLGQARWNLVFLTYLIAVVSLIGVLIFIPNAKITKTSGSRNEKNSFSLTKTSVVWILTMFVFFIGGQIFSNTVSFLISDLNLGTPAEAGLSISIFSVGGFLGGLLFAKVIGTFRRYTATIAFGLIAIGYFIIAFSTNLSFIYLGSFVSGVAFSLIMPIIMVGASNAAHPASVSMTIAFVTAAQNIGASLSPYITQFALKGLGDVFQRLNNQTVLIFGGIVLLLVGIVFFFYDPQSQKNNH